LSRVTISRFEFWAPLEALLEALVEDLRQNLRQSSASQPTGLEDVPPIEDVFEDLRDAACSRS